MLLRNNLQKYIACLVLALFLAEIILSPIQVQAQQESSGASTAALATVGALAAGALAFCLSEAAQEISIFGTKLGKVFQCTVTNPPGVHLLSADGLKKWIIDPAARIVIRALLQATTQQIVAWIQNDGGKNVGYVKNLEQALRREADLAGGEFLNELTGINLCGNIGAYLQITLRTPGLRQRLECSVTDIVRNVDSFYRDFQRGGWPAFIRISLEPQNNPYGAYLIALDAKINAEARRQQGFLEPYKAGRTFRGFPVDKEVCEEISPKIADDPELRLLEGQEFKIQGVDQTSTSERLRELGQGRTKLCHTETEYKTPGTLIADGLTKATFGGLDFAVHAKEFDEAIATIINALILKVINATFAGDSESTSGQGIFDPGVSQVSLTGAENASAFVGKADETISLADATLSAADKKLTELYKELFTTKKEAGAVPTTQAQEKIQELETKIAKLHKDKKTIAAIKTDMLNSKQVLLEAPDSTTVGNFSQKAIKAQSDLNFIANENGLTPSASVLGGSVQENTAFSLQSSIDAITNTTGLIDTVVKELSTLASTTPSATQKSVAEAQRERLLNEAKILADVKSDLAISVGAAKTARTNEEIQRAAKNSVSLIAEAGRKLDRANTAIQTAAQVLK